MLLVLLVVLVGQRRGGDLLLGSHGGVLLREQVQGRSSGVISIAILLIPIGPILATVGVVAQIVVLGTYDVLAVRLGIKRYGRCADTESAIEYTIECIECIGGDGSSIGEGLTGGSTVYDGEEGSGVGGRRGKRATTCDKGGETGSGNVRSKASPDK